MPGGGGGGGSGGEAGCAQAGCERALRSGVPLSCNQAACQGWLGLADEPRVISAELSGDSEVSECLTEWERGRDGDKPSSVGFGCPCPHAAAQCAAAATIRRHMPLSLRPLRRRACARHIRIHTFQQNPSKVPGAPQGQPFWWWAAETLAENDAPCIGRGRPGHLFRDHTRHRIGLHRCGALQAATTTTSPRPPPPVPCTPTSEISRSLQLKWLAR